MKVVINGCLGGFGLSDKAIRRYAELKGLTLYPAKDRFSLTNYYTVPKDQRQKPLPGNWMNHSQEVRLAHNKRAEEECLSDRNIQRNDPLLVQVVEELGTEASGDYAKLRIVEIPDDVQWEIREYDGNEHIAESHRTWV